MALPDPASHQSPLSIDSTIYGIAEMIGTSRDLISFAQVSRQVYASAIRVLYRYIRVAPAKRASDWDERIPKYAYTKDYISTMVQRVALLETLEANTQLAAAVTKLHIFTKPVEFLDRILAACPNLTTLKLEFPEWNPHENEMIARSERLEVPIIPSTVKRLDFIHDGRGQIKRESITQAFSNATLLESVSLCTNVETAQTILKSAGRSITSLELGSLRGVRNILDVEFDRMLACVPDLTFLRLYTITHHQIESISFPPLLQTLDFYTVDFKTVERIIELLATKPIWCPRLTRLVRFGSIGYSADLLRITQNERELRMQKFRDNCGQAFGARASSGFWRGDPSEFKRLANKPRAFGL